MNCAKGRKAIIEIPHPLQSFKLFIEICLFMFLPFSASANLADGLVAYYEFSGNVLDSSGNGNNATVYGATLTPDRFGTLDSAYAFNGAYIRTNNGAVGNLGNEATISLWINPDHTLNATGPHRIIEKDYGAYWSIIIDGGRLVVYLRGSTSFGGPEATLYGPTISELPEGWSSIVVRKTGGQFDLFVNGNLITSQSTAISTIVPGYNMSFGHSEYWQTQGIPQYYFGSIDSARIYNRALSNAEISLIATPDPLDNGLVAYYPFNGNTNDESVYRNNGTNHGATLTTDRFGNQDSAYQFNGVNNYITAGANDLPSHDRTVSLWFYANSDLHPALLSYGGSGACGTTYFMAFNAPLSYYVNRLYTSSHCDINNLVYNYPAPPVGQWYHWVTTINGTVQTMYLDGVKVATNNNFTSPTFVNARQLSLGVATNTNGVAPYIDSNVTYFNGKLDDIRIYSRALSYSEVLNLYNESPADNVGKLLQLQSSYSYSMEQGTQAAFTLDLANKDNIDHSVNIEVLNPNGSLAVTPDPLGSVVALGNGLIPITLNVNATSSSPGSYDVLLKVTADNGEIIYSTITVVVTDPGAVPGPDLDVTVSDLGFSPLNPTSGETVTLMATVHNQGGSSSSATTVKFYDYSTLLGEVPLNSITAGGVGLASLSVSFPADSVRLIHIVVDPGNLVTETDENNNEVTQLLQVGASTGAAGNIIVTGSAPSNVVGNTLFNVNGHAFYDIVVNGVALRDYVVKGGSVQITVEKNIPGGQKWTYGGIHTNINGDFNYRLQAPSDLGEYKLTMTVTDQTFTGQAVLLFNVVDATLPPPYPPTGTGGYDSGGGGGPGGSGSWTYSGGGGSGGTWDWTWVTPPEVYPNNDAFVYSEDLSFSNNNPKVGDEIYIIANIHYWANSTSLVAKNVPVNFYAIFPGTGKMLIGTTVIDNLTVGAPDYGSKLVFTSWRNTVGGIYIIEAEIDPSFIDSNPLNNAATRAIIVGDLSTGAIAGHVRNASGPVSGITLELQDITGAVLSTTQTDSAGGYLFDGLAVGSRQVRIITPADYTPDQEIKPADVTANNITTVDFQLSLQTGPYPPVAIDQDVATDEDVAVDISLQATDADGDPLTYSVVNGPIHGQLTGSAPNVTYHPDLNYNGSDSFTFVANDGLFDSNHATVSITVNPVNDAPVVLPMMNATINEGDTYTGTGNFVDVDNGDSWSATVNYGNGSGEAPLLLNGYNFSLKHIYPDNGLFNVTVTISDAVSSGKGVLNVLVNNVAPTVGPISAPTEPVALNTSINVSADFTDPGVLDTHTAVWAWGDGSTSSGVVTETNGSGSVSGDHAYTVPGVYTILLTVTDKDGGSGQSQYQYVVVYQPGSGFVTGGGWINSTPGAYPADSSLIGKANFGFNAKYINGSSVPDGVAEFQFKPGNINFHSTKYDWLVISGAVAQYKGEGTINGQGNYGFLMSVTDGLIDGSGIDKIRMKIWDKITGVIVYDNQPGDPDSALSVTVLGGGQIVIHN